MQPDSAAAHAASAGPRTWWLDRLDRLDRLVSLPSRPPSSRPPAPARSALVVVHFHADWAPQCKQMSEVMGELAKEHSAVRFAEVREPSVFFLAAAALSVLLSSLGA